MGKERPRLVLENVGPMRHADVSFADLTVLVGPQATGKSIFLQFLKLILDHPPIAATLHEHGLDWGAEASAFLDVYLGRGMSAVWNSRGKSKSCATWSGSEIRLDALAAVETKARHYEQCFVVPAQRVLAFSSQGWLRPFSDFRAGDPYVLRAFGEHLRLTADDVLDLGNPEFRLSDEAENLIKQSLFGRFQPAIQITGAQKEIVLRISQSRKSLPFMVWSAGQREFVPLWMYLMWLLPATNGKLLGDWVIIEEPEMGLHPKAIAAVLFVVLQLLTRGYRVCLSTHSTHVLDLVWALKVLKETKANPEALLGIFDVKRTPSLVRWAKTVLGKESAVYYFDDESRRTVDISSLSLDDADRHVQSWGKLTDFSTQIGEIVARQVSEATSK